MKRKLMEILAGPIDKHHPLELHVFDEKVRDCRDTLGFKQAMQ